MSSGVNSCLTLILILQKKRRVLFDSDKDEEVERLATELAGGAGLEVSNPVEGGKLGERESL